MPDSESTSAPPSETHSPAPSVSVEAAAQADANHLMRWDPEITGVLLPGASPRERAVAAPFVWPTPPFACYGAPEVQTESLPCEIQGLNGSRTQGRLTFFVPEQCVAHIQVPPARTALPLRFDQFRAIVLSAALLPQRPARDELYLDLMTLPLPTTFVVHCHQGEPLRGQTLGHAESPHGLFLFLPDGDSGAVRRMFVPREAFSAFDVGERIGQVLLAQQVVTPQEVEDAAEMQQQLRQQKLGDILVMRHVVTPEQLLSAIEQQSRMPMVRIGEALTSLGLVSEQQLKDALAQQVNDRSAPLGELLVRMGAISREDLQAALARKMGYPLVDIDEFPAEADALRKLSFVTAKRLDALPLLLREGRMVVALHNPANRRAAVEEIEFSAQTKVVPVLARCKDIHKALHSAYERIGAADSAPASADDDGMQPAFEQSNTIDLVATLEREGSEGHASQPEEKQIEQSDNSLVRLINNMIIEASKDGVSDIHIESYPGREKIKIRFRKDGILSTYLELPPNYRNALIARIKIMCDLDISERRKPQDGKINFAKFSPQHRLELRVATIPTNNSLEDVVMRILASAKPIPLDKLGLSPHNLSHLKRAMERPYGLVLCVGPTGSGKTTTLHSALSYINVPERKIWTAEDPVEITQPGLRQVQVNPKIDWTFAKALRAFLRADPDVIMVGEVRDGETAQMAVEASLTGHLVLSTLHTNSAPETVTRLLDMGMDPFNFADSLLAVLAQRLVRRICPSCRQSHVASEEEIDELLNDHLHAYNAEAGAALREGVRADWMARHAKDGRLHLFHSPGCVECNHSGFRGRAGLHELMTISRELRRLVQTGARAEALQHCALGEGMRTLRQDGIDKVLAGITTIEEVRSTSNA